MSEALELRVHGESTRPTLIYLPGIHGDWTLVGSFRRALQGRVRFVEMTYPRTPDWTLDDYAKSIEAALEKAGIGCGWLLGESFGSQVLWPLVQRWNLDVQGIILAGGFGKYPIRWSVSVAMKLINAATPLAMQKTILAYMRISRWRYRSSPEVLESIGEFARRRTEPDRLAIRHRLKLIIENNPETACEECSAPIFAVTGLLDPIVPWFLAKPWLRTHCPSLQAYKIIPKADHNVLGTAADQSAAQVLRWMGISNDPTAAEA